MGRGRRKADHKALEEVALEAARLGRAWTYADQKLVFAVTRRMDKVLRRHMELEDALQVDMFTETGS